MRKKHTAAVERHIILWLVFALVLLMRSDMIIPACTWNHIKHTHSSSSFGRSFYHYMCSVCSFLSIHIIQLDHINAQCSSIQCVSVACLSYHLFFFLSFYSPLLGSLWFSNHPHKGLRLTFKSIGMLRQSLFLSTPANVFKWTFIDTQYSYFVVIWNIERNNEKIATSPREKKTNYLNMWESVFLHCKSRVLTLKHMSLICIYQWHWTQHHAN